MNSSQTLDLRTTFNMEIWTICDKGHVHWGSAGAAGLLFRFKPKEGEPSYLLQRRSGSVDHGGTWGIPGGAIRHGELPQTTAVREAEEEIGPVPSYRVTGVQVQDCGGGWKFYTVMADVDSPFPALCGKETDAFGWFTKADMEFLSLHPGFRDWFERETASR
jgi:8-oxo-dGTP diphosphatase